MNVTWHPEETKWINHFNVTYWARGSPGWTKVSPCAPACLCLPPVTFFSFAFAAQPPF